MSTDDQEEIARNILVRAASEGDEPVPLTEDERAAIARSKADASRSEFSTDDEVRTVWAKYGL